METAAGRETAVTRILAIAPYEGMQIAMERIVLNYPQAQVDVYTGDLYEGVAIVKENEGSAYDVIISRGGTAELIQKVTDTPVVSIQLSVYDILRAIKTAENYSNRYAIVGFPGITGPAHTLCDLLRLDIDIITIHSADEVDVTLERLKTDGFKMVVSDMITHTIARKKGFDAFLITSGAESLHTAMEQALSVSGRYHKLRQENLFLKAIAREKSGNTIVLSQEGELCYFTQEKPGEEQLSRMRARIPEIPFNAPLKFYQSQGTALYRITARTLRVGPVRYFTFHYRISPIPLSTVKNGIRIFGEIDAMQLFINSFYNISGAMGELDARLTAIAPTRQPVMIVGERGTGKEQIARALYLRSPRVKSPFIVLDCILMNDKSWDFLFHHYGSPLFDEGGTVYFQNLDAFPEKYRQELLGVIADADLTKHMRMIFSCTCTEGAPLPETAQLINSRLGCLLLHLPTLRSRADEIPSLASLYLSSLNMELGRQIIGFDPRANEQLLHYDWPNNYTQFKQVLQELATLTETSYINGDAVSEILARERTAHRPASCFGDSKGFMPRTLDEITRDAVLQTVAAFNGNQTAAAKQLKISRTTLWRYLNADKS